MSPLQPHPSGRAVLARLALRRVAVPIANPRVFQVFEQMHERAMRSAAGSPPARPGPQPRP